MVKAWLAGVFLMAGAASAAAQQPVLSCDAAGIGATVLQPDDGSTARILEVSTGMAGEVPYCLVKVLVPQAINIWVGLPMAGEWNGRWQSVGGGGYAGTVNVPTAALEAGFAAATTDTGHLAQDGGRFGMLAPGEPNIALQQDFAYRSEHLMAVLGKQLVNAYYGDEPVFSYWNGCSTGGRQGLRMAQDYPADYDGVLAGAPAIHWDRFQASHLWPAMVMRLENGGPIGGGNPMVLAAKQQLATARAVAACDALDGVGDGIIDAPRQCPYSASGDSGLTSSSCSAEDASCLTPAEARSIDRMWQGPVACADGSGSCAVGIKAERDLAAPGNKRLWYGNVPGTPLTALGGVTPFFIGTEQPRYWVYFDPAWDWQSLDYGNYPQFFADTVEKVGPMMASDNPDLSDFRARGGKLLMYHGWADPLIMAQGSIDYYERVNAENGGDFTRTQDFARLFMAPGVGHCAGGEGPQPQGLFESLVAWVENGAAPQTVLATRERNGQMETRPLCPWPARARWNGQGSALDAANYTCSAE